MNNRPFEEWVRRMFQYGMPPGSDGFTFCHKCPRCQQTFLTADDLALHMQRHKRVQRLSENDRQFLRSIRIQPWDDDDPQISKG